jgi:antitoxin ParD1/3/4
MVTMNVSLPTDLKEYVEGRVGAGSYQSSSEYVRELIRKDQEVQRFRTLIQQGIDSPTEGEADGQFFDEMRRQIRDRAGTQPR